VPSTLTVTNNLDNGSAGSLRAEIAAANPGDTINFAPSLNGQTITLTSGELVLNKSLTIQGPGAGQLSISAGNIWRVFEVDGAATNVNLSGLTIYQGGGVTGAVSGAQASDGLGGGIYNQGTLTLSGCDLDGCNDYNPQVDPSVVNWAGGAIYSQGTLTLSNCDLSGNSSHGTGGGLCNLGALTISSSTLSGNTAVCFSGGGIYNAGMLTISGSTLSGNLAYSDTYGNGGGIYNAGTLTISSTYRAIPPTLPAAASTTRAWQLSAAAP
jgi:hypothetical protein